jgi:hypothetical protein
MTDGLESVIRENAANTECIVAATVTSAFIATQTGGAVYSPEMVIDQYKTMLQILRQKDAS